MKKQKVLVVGGAGFIGSQVNKILNQRGYETIVFDNLSRGDARTVVSGSFFNGDIGNKEDLDSLFSQHSFDAVMHFAAFTDVGESVLNPSVYYQNNVANTLQLLKCMVEHKTNVFIFSSSAAVYGIPQETRIQESAICQPINPYGRTKWMVEQILQDFEKAYGLRYCALRYFNAAGGDPEGEIKNYKSKENNLIPLALRSLLDPNKKISIFGSDYSTPDGTCIRDYIHVADLAEAHLLAMKKSLDNSLSDVYNLGNGDGFSVREVLATVENVTGRRLNIIEADRRPGDPAILIADSTKAREKLGWQPYYTTLGKMIEHAWNALN